MYAGSGVAAYLLRESARRNTIVYVIKTSPAQDAAALAYLRQNFDKPLGIARNNCSTRSNEALDAAAIPDFRNLPVPFVYDIPGTAGARALGAGAPAYNVPQGSAFVPIALGQFEPPGVPAP